MSSRSLPQSTKRKSEVSTSRAASSKSEGASKRPRQQNHKPISEETANSKTSTEKPKDYSNALNIQEETGDIFDAPPNTLIIHACNCQGSWGAGIAKAFKDRYPKACSEYARHCREHGNELLDSAQLISPVDAKENQEGEQKRDVHDAKSIPKHFVGCLYTSRYYGKKKDSPSRILEATKPAMEDLLQQVRDWNDSAQPSERVGEVRICKINSGLFAVPWESTKEVLQSIDASQYDVKILKVVSPQG